MERIVKPERETNRNGQKRLFDIFLNHHTPQNPIPHFPHTHSYFELMLCVKGESFDDTFENGPAKFHSGDIYLIFPNTVHDTVSSRIEPITENIVVKFTKTFLYPLMATESDVSQLISDPKPTCISCIFRAGSPEAQELTPLILDAYNEWEQQKPGYELALRGRLTILYMWIVRHFMKDKPITTVSDTTPPAAVTLQSQDATFHIQKVFEFLESNYPNIISMNDAADLCGMSYSQFSRFFTQMTGQSFPTYLRTLRLSHARKMILNSEKSVTEIASLCGFDYLSYFEQVFKKEFGCTPMEFRDKYCRK